MPSKHSDSISDMIGFDSVRITTQSSGRPNSALDYNGQNLRWGHRPKSTPASARAYHSPTYHQPTNKISRPKTAAVILGRTECDRVHQLEHEATRRHNLENHIPIKRNKPPPWQKNLEPPLVPFVVGPGYIVSRSKSKCHVTIKDEFFEPITDDTDKKKSQGDPERDSLIAQLQQQISDLTLYLEEERLNHKQTKQKAEEYLKDRMEQMTSQHQDYISNLEADHKEEMLRQKRQMEGEHKENQNALERQINRMAKEIEFLQGAFESYKSTLHSETSGKWNVKEEELRVTLDNEKQQALHDLKMKLLHEKNQEQARMTKENQRALDMLRKENKREMDSLMRRFSNAAADVERLKKATAELEEMRAELEQVQASYDETCQKLTSTTRLLTDAKVKLMEFEEKFQEKVAQVDDRYRHKLQELMTQNTELKRLFVQKCGQLFDEKSTAQHETALRVKTARETMETLVKSRQRANVSIAVGGPVDKIRGGKTRPLSAPGTRLEEHSAHQTAGETEPVPKQREFIPPDIKMESAPETEEMRAQLLLEPVQEVSKADLMKSLKDQL